MTQSLSLIHPEAPEFLSAAALYSAPIDVEAAVARIRELWNEDIDLVWEEMPIEGNGAGGGDILRFVLEGVLVLVTPVSAALQPERGDLPDHAFHVAITCYAPLDRSVLPRANGDAAHSVGDREGGAAGEPGRVGRVLSLVRLHFLSLRGPLPSLLGLLLIVGAAGIVSGSIAPVSGFLAGTALVGGLSGVMAERSGINRLLASLPVSRADVVNSYWVAAVLHLLAASALYAAIGLPLGVRPGKLLVLPLILITGQALGIPVFLHFGPGRGLLVWAVSILVVSILAIGALGLLVSSVGPIQDLAPGAMGGSLLLALGAGVLIGLWVLSHRLYLKQDQ